MMDGRTWLCDVPERPLGTVDGKMWELDGQEWVVKILIGLQVDRHRLPIGVFQMQHSPFLQRFPDIPIAIRLL